MTDSAASRRRDLGFALGIVAVSALMIWEARKQPRAPFDPVGAAAVPIATAGVMIALAAVLLLRLWLNRPTRGAAQSLFTASEAVDDGYAVRPGMTWLAIGATAAYVALIPPLGFMAATIAYLGGLGWALSDRGARSTAIVGALALAGGVGLTLGFRAMLIDLP
jgi:hypothetical protein